MPSVGTSSWTPPESEALNAAAATQPKGSAFELVASPGVRRLLFVNLLQSAAWDVHTFVLPILGHDRGMAASTIGVLLGSFAIAAALVRVALKKAAK